MAEISAKKKRLIHTWSSKDIQTRINVILKELENKEQLSKSRRKLLFTKLARLRRAERGECTAGGQLAKHPKTIRSKEKLKRKKEEENKKNRWKHCLYCRGRGHTMQNCRNLKVSNESTEDIKINICFNCGGSDHTLWTCKKEKSPNGELPFAVCFLCHEKGHLSSKCSQNPNGIYPKGGGCHRCGSLQHLKSDCPNLN